MRFGYWADLTSLQLDDSGDSTARWIQAMPLGSYDHPVYGEIQITPDRVKEFAQNVKEGVRGQELDIDYDHKTNGGEAAGWVKDAEDRGPDGLWLLVEWTKKAFQQLKDKAYRYFSPEYNDEWTHPKTGVTHKNVLFGGAITNRPFLKDIVPINLSEIIDKGTAPSPTPSNDPPKGGARMDPKVLRALIGLAETATDDEVTAKLAELKASEPPKTDPPKPEVDPLSKMSVEEVLHQLTDLQGNPGVKALAELVKAQQEQLRTYRDESRKVFVDRQLDNLDRIAEGKKFAVPPIVKERLREVLTTAPEGLAKEVFEAYQSTLELGLIDMTERGWQRRGGDQSPTQQFLTEVDGIMAKNPKMSYAQAATLVARTNPSLSEQYRQDSYIDSEGR
jgi:hypothetical protein